MEAKGWWKMWHPCGNDAREVEEKLPTGRSENELEKRDHQLGMTTQPSSSY